MHQSELTTKPLYWLKMASFGLFLGRGWQFLFWEQQVSFWPHNPGLIHTIGLALLIGAILVWIPQFNKPGFDNYLFVLAAPLFLMSVVSWEEKDFMLAQLIEMTGQWITPVILWLALRNYSSRVIGRWLKVAIALIFTGHGLYAAGIYPRPGNFYAMTQSILGVSYASAGMFLLAAGMMDLLVSAGIFIRSLSTYLLIYAVIWGLLTATARPLAYIDFSTFEGMLNGLHEWLPAMVYRLSHGLLPLAAVFIPKWSN